MAATVFTRLFRAFRDRRSGEPIKLTQDDLLRLTPVELVRLRYIANAENMHERIVGVGELVFEE